MLQTDLDKQHFTKKNELKTYQNERLVDERRFDEAELKELKSPKKNWRKF